jgi:hypothetical protein
MNYLYCFTAGSYIWTKKIRSGDLPYQSWVKQWGSGNLMSPKCWVLITPKDFNAFICHESWKSYTTDVLAPILRQSVSKAKKQSWYYGLSTDSIVK